FWTIAHAGTVVRLRDSKGPRYIAHLLRYRGQKLRALDVVIAVHQGAFPGTAGVWQPGEVPHEAADPQALSQYRGRLAELRAEIDDAREDHDLGRIAALQSEAEWLERHLEQACGLGGRVRNLPSICERARQTLTKGV